MADSWTSMLSQITRIKSKSVTDSLFRFGCVIAFLTMLMAVLKADPQFTWVFMWLTLGLFGLGGLAYAYFALFKPKYLRSEDTHVRLTSMEMLGDKENQLNPNVTKVIYIASPHRLESTGPAIEPFSPDQP